MLFIQPTGTTTLPKPTSAKPKKVKVSLPASSVVTVVYEAK
ncbi:MAG: hypothetical protein ACLS26_02615 [Eubacterium sp.]